jgi:hypothetical protein
MPAPVCINLRERYGHKYRVNYEESYYAQYGPHARVEDPWLQIIPGARGHVFPWDETRLAASTNTSGSIATKLKALPYTEVRQDGADGVNVIFPADRLDEVAAMLQLRRRRVVTREERQRLAALSKLHSPLRRRSPISQSDLEARPYVPEPQVDPEALGRQTPLF